MDVDKSLIKLKELLIALDPANSSTGQNGRQLLELLCQMSRKEDDYFHCPRLNVLPNTIQDIVPRFLHLLRESVLTHQWCNTLQILEIMCKDFRFADRTLWKIEALKTKLKDEQVVLLRDIGVIEVLAEFLLHHLLQGDLSEARDLIRVLKKATPYKQDFSDPKRQAAQMMFNSYQGLALYAKWKRIKLSQEKGALFDDPLSQGGQSVEPVEVAEQAIETMSSLKDVPGVWDIFISRVVEMQVFYGREREAKQMLETYASLNPNNPNAHRYLYELLVQMNGNTEVKKQCLMNLIRLDPCNPLAIDLYKLIESTEPDSESVEILFDYLDFDHCSNDMDVLLLFAKKLEHIHTDAKLRDKIKALWESRLSWWPCSVLGSTSNRLCDEQKKHEIIEIKSSILKILQEL